VHKSPAVYGAFPTDPYSHTPFGKGAQQPGMTGQVKEDIISRFGELGIYVQNGQLGFKPVLLFKNEFTQLEKTVTFTGINGEWERMTLPENSLFFTICQVPVVYCMAEKPGIEITYSDGALKISETNLLTADDTQRLFDRNGVIALIRVFIQASSLLV
jgi:hypothetical protein